MRESKIETHLRREVHRAGGRCLKFVSPGRGGVPDRIVQWPGRTHRPEHDGATGYFTVALTHYVELKAPGKKLRADQRREHAWLRKHGFTVLVLDSIEAVNYYVRRSTQ